MLSPRWETDYSQRQNDHPMKKRALKAAQLRSHGQGVPSQGRIEGFPPLPGRDV